MQLEHIKIKEMSWCAEEFLTSDKQILKLLKYLKKNSNWTIEEAEESFELLWGKL